jgi:hypothetical protein
MYFEAVACDCYKILKQLYVELSSESAQLK